jgi:hypothetical protein
MQLISGFVACAYFGYKEGLSRRCGVWWPDGSFELDDYGSADDWRILPARSRADVLLESIGEGCYARKSFEIRHG